MATFIDRYISSKQSKFVHQGSTPVIENDHLGMPEGERTYTMFIQTARAGTWEPKPGEEGMYTLTLSGLPAQTVYFSDRPHRLVGTQRTSEFLNVLGFPDDNPPNAALVTRTEDGEDDILVIELFNPVYTEDGDGGGTLVYEARILANYLETRLGAVALQQNDTAIPAAFGGASLFIDDCRDGVLGCHGTYGVTLAKYGCCYKNLACHACSKVDSAVICRNIPGCEEGCDTQPISECLWPT
jgi:hypothetical protein